MTVTRCLVCCLLYAVGSMATAAEYYRWVDENGNTQFTQTPPPEGLKAEKGMVRTAPATAPSGKEWLEKKQKNFKDLDKERAQAKEREAEKQKLAADNARDCNKIKRRLRVLTETPRVQKVSADGVHTVISGKERQSEIGRMQGLLSEHCG